jgi:hypothetical protein
MSASAISGLMSVSWPVALARSHACWKVSSTPRPISWSPVNVPNGRVTLLAMAPSRLSSATASAADWSKTAACSRGAISTPVMLKGLSWRASTIMHCVAMV